MFSQQQGDFSTYIMVTGILELCDLVQTASPVRWEIKPILAAEIVVKKFNGQEESGTSAAEPDVLCHRLAVLTSPNSHPIHLPSAPELLSLLNNFCSPGCFHQKSSKAIHLVLR